MGKDKIKVIYRLTQQERKIDILNGGNGEEYQYTEINEDPKISMYVKLSNNGQPYIDLEAKTMIRSKRTIVHMPLDSDKVIDIISKGNKTMVVMAIIYILAILVMIAGMYYISVTVGK